MNQRRGLPQMIRSRAQVLLAARLHAAFGWSAGQVAIVVAVLAG